MSRQRSRTQRKKSSLRKRVLLHPLYMFGVLCFGVVISAYTLFASADGYQVHAVVPAPLPTFAAEINFPATESVAITAPLEVTGTCPIDSYVKLFRNGAFSGVDQCSDTGTFMISTDLAVGKSELVAQAYNHLNQSGPAGTPVVVYYKPTVMKHTSVPTPAANAVVPEEVAKQNNYAVTEYGPLQLIGEYAYQEVTAGNTFSWGLDLRGGSPPYNVNVDWGDGEKTQYYFTEDPAFTIKHDYKTPGKYDVMVDSVDAQGYRVQMQLSAVIHKVDVNGIVGKITNQNYEQPNLPGIAGINTSWLYKILWPSYFTILLMSVSYWLGQHRELEILRKEAVRLHKRRPV